MIKRFLHSLRSKLQRRFGVRPLSNSIPELEAWYQTALGQAVLAEEQEQIDKTVNYLFGYHLMQLSVAPDLPLSRNSTINHRFGFSPVIKNNSSTASNENSGSKHSSQNGYADPERMPLISESVDVAILHHVLDFTQNPHHLLRETARVLIPRGYVVIVGFNPTSAFGLCKTFGRLFSRRAFWNRHSLRLGRVIDWLQLLDFEPVEISHGYFRAPINKQSFISRTHWYEKFIRKTRLPIGGFYLILARKDTVGMTPIKPVWKNLNPMEGLVGSRGSSRTHTSSMNTTVKVKASNKKEIH